MILIITNKEDAHPTPVIERLSARGVPVFRLNTEALLTDYDFGWVADDVYGSSFWIRCRLNGLETTGREITAVWDRRPEKPEELPYPSTTEIDRHNREEALGFLVFLRYWLKDIPSIGCIVNDRPAASKMLQYAIAREIGFKIPKTCFSNCKEPFLKLMYDCTDLIIKPIEVCDIWDEKQGVDYVFYAQTIPAASLREVPDEAFSQTVSFVQEYVEKAFELRVTAVGNRTFACKIDSQVQQMRPDALTGVRVMSMGCGRKRMLCLTRSRRNAWRSCVGWVLTSGALTLSLPPRVSTSFSNATLMVNGCGLNWLSD